MAIYSILSVADYVEANLDFVPHHPSIIEMKN